MDIKKLAIIIISATLLTAGSFLGTKKILLLGIENKGTLQVNSIPDTSIFLDNNNIGKTPFVEEIEAGEYMLKLIPEGSAKQLNTWQEKIKIIPKSTTYVNQELGKTVVSSAGEITYLEKIDSSKAQIEVDVTPEGAIVSIDGVEQGQEPVFVKNTSEGEHKIEISSPGFIERSVVVNTYKGFKVIVKTKLAISGEKKEKEKKQEKTTEKKEEINKPYVKILDTPTGWLRVRSKPTTASSESAKVNPGEKYPYLDEQKGWYKIEYEKDKQGWIFGKYAEKVE